MNQEDIAVYFNNTVRETPEISPAVAAIQTLIEFMKLNAAETIAELRKDLNDAINTLTSTDSSVTSVSSGCELFIRFITLASLDIANFQDCKRILIERSDLYLNKIATSRKKIAKLGHPFIRDGAVVLTHSRSRVVLQTLIEAATARKRFQVYVTESGPDKSGISLYNQLTDMNIPCTVILDSAMGYIMEKVDLVLVGAEGVVESGGIINKIGTFTMAIAAKEMNKPFYVLAESFKFVRLYPLNQQDVPNKFKYAASRLQANADLTKEHPLVDYTSPAYITLLFTDLGILTPSAVSDELIKLYL